MDRCAIAVAEIANSDGVVDLKIFEDDVVCGLFVFVVVYSLTAFIL